jgi:hypothetical protein
MQLFMNRNEAWQICALIIVEIIGLDMLKLVYFCVWRCKSAQCVVFMIVAASIIRRCIGIAEMIPIGKAGSVYFKLHHVAKRYMKLISYITFPRECLCIDVFREESKRMYMKIWPSFH